MDTTGTMELVSCLAATTPCEASLSGGTDGEMEASSQNPFTCHQPSQVPLSQPSSQPPSKGNTPRLQASEILLALSASAPSTSPDGLTHSMGEAAAKNRKRRISASLAPYNVLESELSNASLSNQSEQGAKRPRTSSDIRPPPPSFDVNTLSSPAGSHRMHLPPPFQQQPHVLLASSSDPLPSHGRYRSFSVSSVSLPLPPPLTVARTPPLSDVSYHLPLPAPLSASTSPTQRDEPYRHAFLHPPTLPSSGSVTPVTHHATTRLRLPSLSAVIKSHQAPFPSPHLAPSPGHRRTTSTPLPAAPAASVYKPKFKYSDSQKAVLQREFVTNPYPSHARKEALGRETGTTATQVQFWFQNQRQKVARAGGGARPVAWVGELVRGKGR